MDTKTVNVEALEVEDEFWADKPFAYSDGNGYADDPDEGDYLVFKVIGEPITSINTSLFDGPATCVVVAVEYPDGARGSRLYKPSQVITIRRPS